MERELSLIAELRYEPFFLTVHDIVRYARSRDILCQGRGSAANSAVCYALGITEVNPAKQELLFERFISKERNEPPDIDVDFEHQRREEVIQYVYGKYGRERAALAATLITYQPKSALRDVGKALGLDALQVDRIAKSIAWWDDRRELVTRLRDAGFDPESPVMRHLMGLASALLGFPRHLSQHVGGFVISRGALARLVPIDNAAMPERSVIQWDKDDLENLGLLKVDVLALGMLSVIRRALDFVNKAGARFVRIDLPWPEVAPFTLPASWEPENPADPNYMWKRFDATVSAAVAAGLTPVIAVEKAPTWAQGCKTPPPLTGRPCRTDPAALADAGPLPSHEQVVLLPRSLLMGYLKECL